MLDQSGQSTSQAGHAHTQLINKLVRAPNLIHYVIPWYYKTSTNEPWTSPQTCKKIRSRPNYDLTLRHAITDTVMGTRALPFQFL